MEEVYHPHEVTRTVQLIIPRGDVPMPPQNVPVELVVLFVIVNFEGVGVGIEPNVTGGFQYESAHDTLEIGIGLHQRYPGVGIRD